MAKLTLTTHAKERMLQRRITVAMVESTIKNCEGSFIEKDGDTQFFKNIKGRKVEVVAKPLERRGDWLVKTVWIEGEKDPNPLMKLLSKIIVQAFWKR